MKIKRKDYRVILMFFIATITSCDDCRNNDCGGDDIIVIKLIGDDQTNYSDSIDFYYYDENQKKIEAEIERDRYSLSIYYAYLDYRRSSIQNIYYLQFKNQLITIDVEVRYDKDPCCGDYLRFETIQVDGKTIPLPIEVIID